jgi:hypothetical protein
MSANKTIYTNYNFGANTYLNSAKVQNSAMPPATPQAGQIYFDTALNQFGVYDGANWQYMGTVSAVTWLNSALSRIDYIKTTAGAPTTTGATTGEKLLNTVDNKLYTSTAGDTWNAGVTLTAGQRYLFSLTGTGTGTGITATANQKVYQSSGVAITAYTPVGGDAIIVVDVAGTFWIFNGTTWDAQTTEATTASNGLTEVVNDIRLALFSLTTAASTITAAGTDYFVFTDTSDSNAEKKATIFSLIGLFAGNGLAQNVTSGALEINQATPTTAQTGTATNEVVTPASIVNAVFKFTDAFVGADWGSDGAGGFVITYAGIATTILTPLSVIVKEGNNVVDVSVSVVGSDVTIGSNVAFDGDIAILGNGTV